MTFQIKRRFSCFVTIAVATFWVLATTSAYPWLDVLADRTIGNPAAKA